MQEPTLLYKFVGLTLLLDNYVTVSAPTGGRDNILIKWKWYKADHGQNIDDSADGTHALRDFTALCLTQIDSLDSRAKERRTEPPDHSVSSRESNSAQRQRGD